MIAIDLIKDSVPPLKASDTASKALSWMDEFRVSHLPVVNKTEYLGLISEEDILNMNEPDKPLSSHHVNLSRPFVRGEQHVYEAVKLMSSLKLSVLPVLSNEDEYLGMITTLELIDALATIAAIDGVGGILVLELNVNDYSLSEIARIIETNDAKVLSFYVTTHTDSTKLDITLKIDKMDLSRIIAAFNRFNYTVKSSFHESGFNDDMRARFDSLMNYLKI